MAAGFSVESVKQFILEKGGRIRNHELVTHFKGFLNHPEFKAVNREKFKDFVNELATIKVEEGEKILVLKRKHRPESTISSGSSSSISSSRSSISSDQAPFQPPLNKAPYLPADNASAPSQGGSYGYAPPHHPQEADVPQFRQYPPPSGHPEAQGVQPMYGVAMRAHSEPPDRGDAGGPREAEEVDGMMMSKVHSDENLDIRLKGSTRQNTGPGGHKQSFDASTASLASTESQGSLSSTSETVSGSGEEEGGNVSVLSIKERVQHLNKISSETDLQTAKAPTPRKKTVKDRDDDDESHSSGGTAYITLSPEEKEWMLVSSTADYHEMFRLLTKNGRLAKVKDISNTALHWAAKFGKPEVVKMLANKIGVNVNQRSNGYTPLHMAAIHGHEEIIELLITVYKADINIRDYSGKKPKQYLKNSASSRIQRMLSYQKGLDLGAVRSSDDSFTRLGSARQSNRTRALSSLIQASSSVMRQPMLRSSWEGSIGSQGRERTPGSTPPGSGPTSPAIGRRSKEERHLMPPPHLPSQRRRRPDNSRSCSRERLNSQSRSTGTVNKDTDNVAVPRSGSDPALPMKTFI